MIVLLIFISGCKEDVVEEEIVEVVEEEVIEEVKECPESCDDGDECTNDSCDEGTDFECVNEKKLLCCGNGDCEITEDSDECPADCQDCSELDVGVCEESYNDLATGECGVRAISPCCGNGVCDSGEDFDFCSDDCPQELSLGLYPDFIDDNALIVVGREAPAKDVFSATYVQTSLDLVDISVESVLHDEVDDVTAQDLILIGMPCDNPFMMDALKIGECEGYASSGVIMLTTNGEHEIVVVSGGTTAQVESAAQYLSDLDNEMSGTEVVVG